jgi:hypothetical protein
MGVEHLYLIADPKFRYTMPLEQELTGALTEASAGRTR